MEIRTCECIKHGLLIYLLYAAWFHIYSFFKDKKCLVLYLACPRNTIGAKMAIIVDEISTAIQVV